jgi:uncharacterized protein YjbI with pentapeptide repeats
MRKPVDLGFEDISMFGEIEYLWSMFRTSLSDCDFSSTDLSNASITRCLVEKVNFSNVIGSPVRLCWNDFVECDFNGSDLTGADFRGSIITSCRFDHANLANLDLRLAGFHRCTFDRCNLDGALVTLWQYLFLRLDSGQKGQVRCRLTRGQLPPEG